jgi:hypothetical protein
MFEVKGTERLRYLVFRCYRCKRILTKLQILDKWLSAEADGPRKGHNALCVCGSRHIVPTDLTAWEEITTPRVWVLWFYEVLVPWLRKKLA